jgi:hypothetical protein
LAGEITIRNEVEISQLSYEPDAALLIVAGCELIQVYRLA